jgi:hypothetical protein
MPRKGCCQRTSASTPVTRPAHQRFHPGDAASTHHLRLVVQQELLLGHGFSQVDLYGCVR